MKKITLVLMVLGCVLGHARTNTFYNFVCPIPQDLIVTNITLTAATFSWSAGADETNWEIVIVPMGSPAPNASTEGTEISGIPTYTASNLTPGTYYSVYLKADCGSESSTWTAAVHLTTLCDPTSEFSENLETTAVNGMPTCWSKILSGPSLSPSAAIRTVSNNAYDGTKSIQLLKHTTGDDSHVILVSPNLGTLATATHRVKFFAKSSVAVGSIELGTVDILTNEFTFYESVAITNVYGEYSVDFTAYEGTDTYIGFRQSSAINTSVYLDNIRWEMAPACADVSNIIVDGTTTNSVTFSWTANDGETAWDIVYGDSSATDPSLLTPITPAPTTNEGAVVSGLTESTTYKFWVRSVCGTDANGYWMGPITVTTACAPVSSFNENFDSTPVGSFPNCWKGLLTGSTVATSSYVSVYNGTANSGANCVRMNNTNSGADANIMLVSPNLSDLSAATHRLRFYARSNGGVTTLDVGTLNNNTDDAIFTSYQALDLTDQYVEYIIDFGDYTGTDTYIALKNASVATYKLIYIDDVKWEAIPACADVTDISITDISTSFAVVNWLAGNSETSWQVAYGTAAITNPELAITSEVLTQTNLALDALTAGTSYNVWVRSVCDEGNGNWIGPIPFNSECNAMTSFDENFDSVNFPNLPLCWSKIITGASAASDVSVTPYSSTSGPNSVQLYGEYSGPTANIILVSPPVSNLSSGNYQLKFKGTGSLPVEVGTLNGNTSEATFTVFETVTLSEFSTQPFTIDFASYTGTDTYIGFRLQTNNNNAYANLDDAVWEQNLATDAFHQSQVRYFPNPVVDVLQLASDENIENVTVFNLLGQKVMVYDANSTSVRMDMSALVSGSYVVKVTTPNQTQTIKIVKK